MLDIQRNLDLGSRIVILVTLALFAVGLFLKGLGHDLVLETGVFLVSVKLIMLVYKNSVTAKHLNDRLDALERTLARMEGLLEARHQPELGGELPDRHLEPPAAAHRTMGLKGGDGARD